MRNIVVTGAGGQLGTALRTVLPKARFLTRVNLDLNDLGAVRPVLEALSPDLVINCAAYTAVDRAEQEEELATRVNGHAVGEMAQFCSTNDISFITYSTDYVFGGEAGRPWLESDPTNPINAYGRSKRVGEQLTLEHGGLVIRTSWVVSGTHPNFVATMLRHSRDRILRVVNDQHGCPTIAHDLAEATARIGTGASGLVHLVNAGETTWFDFAKEAVRLAEIDPAQIEACASIEFPTPAVRPAYSVLGSERLDELKIRPLPPWRASLPAVVEQLLTNGVVDRR